MKPIKSIASARTNTLLLTAVSLFAAASCLTGQVPGYTIKTVAMRLQGSGYGLPAGVAVDSSGIFYFCDLTNDKVYKVSGNISTAVGGSATNNGLIGDGGPATSAHLSSPNSVILDGSGDMYIADTGDNRIRKVSGGTITTVAGPGSSNGTLGDGGSALDASLSAPTDMALDAHGNLYIADSGHNRVRMVSPSGTITTFAGTGSATAALGDGGQAVLAGLLRPTALAIDSAGNLYISDYGHNRIRKVSPAGIITTVAGNGNASYFGDGGLATIAAINAPQQPGDTDPGILHIAVDAAGNLYIADSGSGRLRVVTPAGIINTIALSDYSGNLVPGDPGPAFGGSGGDPIGVALGAGGTIYVSNIEIVALLTPTEMPISPLPFIVSKYSASAFGQFGQLGQGSWLEIYGSYLAADSRSWSGSDFVGANAPTSLDHTSVTIGGQPAFISYISPGQVNAQVPTNIGTGVQPLVVTTAAGSSATYTVTVNTSEPGLLAPASFLIGSTQYVAALFSDGVTFVLPEGAIPGVPSRPAMPGETIVLYGIGFGAVTPSVPAGIITGGSNSLVAPFHLFFGSTEATVAYAGLTPSEVGLDQFNVVVPNVAANNAVPVTFTLGGIPGTQSLSIAVGN
jgi:uncharacterized protein (TIGR03437 family)